MQIFKGKYPITSHLLSYLEIEIKYQLEATFWDEPGGRDVECQQKRDIIDIEICGKKLPSELVDSLRPFLKDPIENEEPTEEEIEGGAI